MSDKKSYVVYYCEQLKDGIEEGAKVITGLDNALAFAEKMGNGFFAATMNIRLFELGKEIPLESSTTNEEVEVVTRTKTHFKVKA